MVTWGFLSTARINDAVLAGARLADRAHVAAVASRDCSRAQAYARERGIERAHGSYEALLADEDIEAVYISLPNSLHVEWSIRALEAGKHVLCEKPLSRHADEVERAFDAAERADRFLMEGFMYRHHPQTKRVAELVGDGAIGELRLVRSAFSFALAELGDVRMRPELDGGSLMDVGCYCVSFTRVRSEGVALVRDPFPIRGARDRAAPRRRDRAGRGRAGGSLPAATGELRRRDPRRSRPAARARGRRWAGAGD